MRFSAAIALAASAGLAAAQSSTSSAAASTSTSSCAAQNILDACLQIEQPKLDSCPANDWECMCEGATNLLTCYNNCPGDDGQFGASQTMTSYCNAAKAYAPSSTSAAPVATGSSAPGSGSSGASASPGSPTMSSAPSGSSGAAAADATNTGAASGLVIPTGGLLSIVFGLVALA